ncbi:MAG TPA: hypothetical protein VGO09_03860 [Flavisolibacter sp.]|jgi:hypothetical protein|nr:hypothetical protein [Flavisolibacter sp.]
MQTLVLEDGRAIFEESLNEDQKPEQAETQELAFKEIEQYHSSKEILISEIEKSRRMIIILVSLLISLSIIFIGLLIK